MIWGHGRELSASLGRGCWAHGLYLPHPNNRGLPQVYAGNVLYEHEMPAEPFWETHDTVKLRLVSPPAPDLATTLAVAVTFEAACPQRSSRLWRNTGEQHDRLTKSGGHWERTRGEGAQSQGQPTGPGML